MTPHRGWGVAQALVCLLLLGTMPIIAESRPQGFEPLSFAVFLSAWQFAASIPLFIAEAGRARGRAAATRRPRRTSARTLLVAASTGAMFGAATYLYVLAIGKIGAVNAAIAIQAYPVIAMICEFVILRRRKSPEEIMLTGVLLAALFYLSTQGSWRMEAISIWFLAALGVPFFWSVAHIVIKEEFARSSITPIQVTFFRLGVSTVFLAVILAVVDPTAFLRDARLLEFQAFALLMGAVYYVEILVWFYAVRHIDVSLASSVTTPWPAVTMVLAVIFLDASLAAYQLGAFAVIAASLYALLLVGARKARAA